MSNELWAFIFIMGVYGLAAAVSVFRILAKRRKRLALALRCSCKTHATVRNYIRTGRRGKSRFELDYYDHKGNRYFKFMLGPAGMKQLQDGQIVEIYFAPEDPGVVSMPTDNLMAHDYEFMAVMLSVAYVCVALIAIWFFASGLWHDILT